MSDRSRFALDKYCYESSIDILAVQESYTSDESNLDLKYMNYVTDCNSSVNRGAMIYVNTRKLCITPLVEISKISKNIDAAWSIVTGKAFRFIVGSIYLKLNYKDAVKDLLAMLDSAKKLSAQLNAKGVIAFGDYNARHQMWGDNTENSYGKQIATELKFEDYTIISSAEPTFLSDNGNSLIDFMITSTATEHLFTDMKTDVYAELFSGAPIRGHVPILSSINTVCVENAPVPPKLKIDISSIDWAEWSDYIEDNLKAKKADFSDSDATSKWDIINTSIHAATSKFATHKKSTPHSKPYWTDRLSQMSKALREAKRLYMKRNTLSNKTALDDAKNLFDETRKKECQKFILTKTNNLNASQCTKFWKEFNRMFSKKRDNKVEPFKKADGDLITDPTDIEEILFDSFFAGKHLLEKGTDFDAKFYEDVNRIYMECLECNESDPQASKYTTNDEDDMLNREITKGELQHFFKNYQTAGKSFDNVEFHPIMLKKLGETACECILALLNSCLKTGHWVWDIADVIFLKKDGKTDYSKAGSYRPISITSYIGKVFEQIIASRLEEHFKKKGLSDEYQEGFTKKRNTVRYLNRLDNDVRSHLQKKYTVICLFIDFEKAFDSVWKKGLMKKLSDFGVSGSLWKLINSFLFNRKVRLIFNNYTGFIRACREFGLPQGSALSPILFKFYLHDLAQDLSLNPDIGVYKFADDGTLRVRGETTHQCLLNLQMTCDVIYKWSITWRMIINCDPGKTELIGFGTAENDAKLLPMSFHLGSNKILFVEKTKVLGLIMDRKLTYIDHAKDINRKILGRWATICKYTNRNWGFRQHVIVRLIEVLIYSRIHYAGTVWINNRSIKEIESAWYRTIKAALGAVFNVRISTAEMILGVLPLTISNKVNSVKHLLKLNIFPDIEDPLKKLINTQTQLGSYSPLTGKIKDVFQFLSWKSSIHPEHFTKEDQNIINNHDLEKFSSLSIKGCSYSKSVMKHYSEQLWQSSINSQYQLEGYTEAPTVSTTKLKFPPKTSRQLETLFLSLFYPNNIMNEFLHRFNSSKFDSPLCECGRGEQNSLHLLIFCPDIQLKKRNSMSELLISHPLHNILNQGYGGNSMLISWSRLHKFFDLAVEITRDAEQFLRTEIKL